MVLLADGAPLPLPQLVPCLTIGTVTKPILFWTMGHDCLIFFTLLLFTESDHTTPLPFLWVF